MRAKLINTDNEDFVYLLGVTAKLSMDGKSASFKDLSFLVVDSERKNGVLVLDSPYHFYTFSIQE